LVPKAGVIERYKRLKYRNDLMNKPNINYETMVKNALEKYPNLTPTEALLIFAYTDEFLYRPLNKALRNNTLTL
jgi:hypothetical protein